MLIALAVHRCKSRLKLPHCDAQNRHKCHRDPVRHAQCATMLPLIFTDKRLEIQIANGGSQLRNGFQELRIAQRQYLLLVGPSKFRPEWLTTKRARQLSWQGRRPLPVEVAPLVLPDDVPIRQCDE